MTNTLTRWQRAHGGAKKGKPIIISMGRRSGKSALTQATLMGYYQEKMKGEWGEWKPAFIWPWDSKMSVSKEKIWGRIMQRHNKLIDFTLYATKKEVFQRKLKGLDE